MVRRLAGQDTEGQPAQGFDLHGLIFEAASDGTPADRRVDPAIHRRVGDCGQSLQVFQRVNVLAVTGAIDQQVIDGGVGREARESGLELGSGQPAEVRDGEAGLERLELAPGDGLGTRCLLEPRR